MRRGGLGWVTRTQPAAEATAERVRALGFQPLVRPLLEVQPLGEGPIETAGAAAIVFTSANAVEAFAARSNERALRAFAVGDATAGAARAAGFTAVLSAEGDVAALAGALIARRRELTGGVLYPSAAEPSQDLAALLAPSGLAVRRVPLYETTEARIAPALIARLPDIDAVLLHSPRAGRALAALLAEHPAPHMLAVCISPQTAAPLAGAQLAGLLAASAPNEASLLLELAQSVDG